MPTDWTKDEDTPIPEGTRRVTVHKIVYGRKGGDPFVTRNGDPQIMLCLTDGQGGECITMLTLSPGAKKFVRKALAAMYSPVELAQMTFDVGDLARQDVAEKVFRGRSAIAKIEYDADDRADVEWKAWTPDLNRAATSAPAPVAQSSKRSNPTAIDADTGSHIPF